MYFSIKCQSYLSTSLTSHTNTVRSVAYNCCTWDYFNNTDCTGKMWLKLCHGPGVTHQDSCDPGYEVFRDTKVQISLLVLTAHGLWDLPLFRFLPRFRFSLLIHSLNNRSTRSSSK